MPQGSLEVFLASAKGLEDTDFLFKMDPYVILTCRTQEQKSSVASGSEPVWNENFIFNVSEGAEELKLKIMDSDIGNDDFVGEAESGVPEIMMIGMNILEDGRSLHTQTEIGLPEGMIPLEGEGTLQKEKGIIEVGIQTKMVEGVEGGGILQTKTRHHAVSILIFPINKVLI
ncbi:hypothetical protein V6Z11_A08G208700 [Gossypium hirsutum]|uniref:Elicitor-responsive protein 3 isoform X2 n=1 Tax=Gossypium hirsutum TaxID=3635 RepID=A0ABM2YJV4_GOSHI|nr:elicitor-responsive protein 3-like isoform X2 [Gossypium hirsutum]